MDDGDPRDEIERLEARIDDGIPAVQGVRVEIQQILLNLIFNACESMSSNTPEERRIEIVALLDHESGGFVRTSVLDYGAGIGQEHLERIFERFYRVDRARSRDVGGTGLGLSIVKHLVQEFDGTIGIASEPGSGTTFTVRLPLSA